MVKIIKIEEIQKDTKKFYETCSDISILQRELEEMLVAIEKNAEDFERGKISKDLFKYNEDKMKKESAGMIKKINDSINMGISIFNKINKEVESQKIILENKSKENKKKAMLKKIKKKAKTKKVVKKEGSIEGPTPAPSPEQKAEQGS
jgi:hypothetical protein